MVNIDATSPEQRGFIHGRHIHDYNALASEAFNMLDSKVWCGNLAFKVDITKAFDTFDWRFLLKVLQKFGFNSKFCEWINIILNSANLSININGALSAFSSAPAVFDRAIRCPRYFFVSQKRFLADCSIKTLISTFQAYAAVSGQVVNCDKSFIFGGAMSSSKLNIMADLSGFKIGSQPFSYLGVPIFKGKPRAVFLQPIADKIINKLSSWKGSLLSFAGRVELVKSSIQGMLSDSMFIYSWPISLIRRLERAVKCFIWSGAGALRHWSGDSNKTKVVTVAWSDMCLPTDEGGLGLRSLVKLNEASNLKLAWDLLSSSDSWAILMRQRVMRKHKIINHHIFSSIWSSVKSEMPSVLANSSWCLGNGKDISLWYANWCGAPLFSSFTDPTSIKDQKPLQDRRVWSHSQFGDLSAKLAYEFKRLNAEETDQHLFFDCEYASCLWKWLQNILNLPFPISGWPDIWSICRRSFSAQCKTLSTAAFIFIFNAIWMARNKVRFHNMFCSISSSISYILDDVSLAGNCSSVSSYINMEDFMIIKSFDVSIRPPRAPNILEVIWKPPPNDWFKIYCDGAATLSGLSGCGGIARNSDGVFLGAFASCLDGANSLTAELYGAILAIEFAFVRNWNNIWLETDSTAVVKAFNSPHKVPWQVRNRWLNCINIVTNWNFLVSHIFREGNSCADALVNHELTLPDYTFFSSIPSFLRADFVKNRLGMPFFRFVSF
ncbi:uncharacterized protein LOC131651114 [Vicia villosa]|uniref:uncharacterized protein LOC131651114 n=1 Tax=Vicia villosa TaxID=3911 RepID=UPI00273BDBDE|nr:uncharacterized protein LOC131651114 [Vicia villosa]